ncbi:putative RDD family membrane protein YckC [Sphingomonas aurantiaca]|uniref:Putative RDD family membrane protein YckC n=1 Tax=Sphingomonas aurantiaca TaxID=185949 RepID=A0A2T5GSI5_9SPHN|nr:RDD family protein [Sphingomonas aurantiaca]PTQ62271.1 putative RDD family membrane protein YckC [Sphingomonas aurantiaca]
MRNARRTKAPVARRRSFVTPEGVDLQLELGGAGTRAAAFLIDVTLMLIVMIAVTLALFALDKATQADIAKILWLIGAFVLRNGWFVLFEMGGRGATPGKRLMRLRVVARDGARLTAGAVLARNAMREIEVFLPLSFLGAQAAAGTADAFLTIFAMLWTGIFLFFPLFNRDRLRIGDLVAGTWVVQTAISTLAADLAPANDLPRRIFPETALALYGNYELQALEDVIRGGDDLARITVAAAIRRKAGLPDDGDDDGFLADYYAALCARLEGGLLVGRRRLDKLSAVNQR